MSALRTQLAQVIARRSLKGGANKKLVREIAAFLLAERKVTDLDPLVRDVWADYVEQGYIEVGAISAHSLNDKTLADIKLIARKLYPSAKKVVVTTQIDPSLVGGLRLELPHQQLDLSLEAKLDKFKRLATASTGQPK